MNRCVLTFSLGLILLGFSGLLWAQDAGVPDTLYVEAYGSDTLFVGQPKLVRVPIRVTHDVPNPVTDSIAGFVIPLRYWHSNPSKYCSLSQTYNRTYPLLGETDRCIFRHLPNPQNPTELNWMMSLAEQLQGQEWDFTVLDLGDGVSQFHCAMVPTGHPDQLFWEGSRVLLATMTFQVEDTMTVCMDTAFWPPSDRLTFSNAVAETYVPRHNLEYCFSIIYPERGDCNGDGTIDLGDVVYLLNYQFKGGAPPPSVEVGDANCDGEVHLGDIVALLNYLYKAIPLPDCT
jgi:hypothetical protein